jgi:transcription elongation GreA/GreB family factor
MSIKKHFQEHHLQLLQDKMDAFSDMIQALAAGEQTDAKSSAGDKHETAVSMAQLEQERINKQLSLLQQQYLRLKAIDATAVHQRVGLGSLVFLNSFKIFIGVSLPKTDIQGHHIIGISPETPIGEAVLGRERGDTFSVNGVSYQILELY